MPYRWTCIRTVDPTIPHDRTVDQPFSLWWAALAAAEETLQGGPLVPAWLRLFTAHLSTIETVRLRWGGDLAESSELRRAYSGLYGRYFARALLASRLGLTDFVSLRTNITRLPNGVTIKRIQKGDIPDWIAWDPATGQYVLCEAKGRLTGKESDFLTAAPGCITDGKKQFDRVQVTGASGNVIATRNWIAANLWSTDTRSRASVSLLWDPPGGGQPLLQDERERHADGIRRRHIAGLALKLARPGLLSSSRKISGVLVHVTATPEGDGMPRRPLSQQQDEILRPIERPAKKSHSGDYIAALITPLGIRPIIDKSDITVLERLRDGASLSSTPSVLFGLSVDALHAGQTDRKVWISSNGIAAPGGLSLFDIRKVEIKAV